MMKELTYDTVIVGAGAAIHYINYSRISYIRRIIIN